MKKLSVVTIHSPFGETSSKRIVCVGIAVGVGMGVRICVGYAVGIVVVVDNTTAVFPADKMENVDHVIEEAAVEYSKIIADAIKELE